MEDVPFIYFIYRFEISLNFILCRAGICKVPFPIIVPLSVQDQKAPHISKIFLVECSVDTVETGIVIIKRENAAILKLLFKKEIDAN